MRLHRHHHHHNNSFEGRAARWYDVMARRLVRPVYRRLAADVAAAAPHGAAVLDVGTGPAVLLVELARLRPDLRLTGVDPSADMVAAAERNLRRCAPDASAVVGDATHLPFPDGAFDLIVTSFSLHHWDDVPAAGAELARVLRPGGRVLVYDFRFAPFDELTAATAGTSLAGGPEPERTRFRPGFPLPRAAVRLVLHDRRAPVPGRTGPAS
ncbi:MAG: class I SAM-dependent methyltransferase [Micromonosporaceae bacterium]|jgi:ubiquinone/menaquinone biosynthesis C-methylase UbiE